MTNRSYKHAAVSLGRRFSFPLSLTLMLLVTSSVGAQGWLPLFGIEPENQIQAVTPTVDGFVAAGLPVPTVNDVGVTEYHLLRVWRDGQWTTVGDVGIALLQGGGITDIAVYRDDYCVGGSFTSLGSVNFPYFACWSTAGERWYQPGGDGNGPAGPVQSIWFDGAIYLYLGGDFVEVRDLQGDPLSANHVVRTDGSEWQPLPGSGGITNGVASPVSEVKTFNGSVYVLHGSSVSRWNPTNSVWALIGTSLNGAVPGSLADLAFFGNELVVNGGFDLIGGAAAPGIAATPLAAPDWAALGDGSIGPGQGGGALVADSSFIYSVGAWPGLSGADGIARWGGFVWEAVDTVALGSNPAQTILDLFLLSAGDLCIHHQGLSLSDLASTRVACKRSQNEPWRGVSQGLVDGRASVLAEFGGDIYAAGDFLAAGDDALAAGLARWNGERWSAVGTGLSGDISSFAIYQGELYAAGSITAIGGTSSGGLVAWNGSQWRDVGGAGVRASTIHVFNDVLYLFGQGGACGGPLDVVCSWDGSTFVAVSSSLPTPVSVAAIADYQGQLIVAGNFSVAGGARQDAIAALDAGQWNVLASFPSGQRALTLSSGAELFFGGDFATVFQTSSPASVSASRVAKWDGSQVSALGDGLADGPFLTTRVLDLQVVGGDLYVAGDFSMAGAVQTQGVARWDGSQWHSLDGGLIDTGLFGVAPALGEELLSAANDTLYVGGIFQRAGDIWASGIAAYQTSDVIFRDDFE